MMSSFFYFQPTFNLVKVILILDQFFLKYEEKKNYSQNAQLY